MEVVKFPNELKLGKIVHQFTRKKVMNYLKTISLYNNFVSKGILHNKQFGFRKYHSTSHALTP